MKHGPSPRSLWALSLLWLLLPAPAWAHHVVFLDSVQADCEEVFTGAQGLRIEMRAHASCAIPIVAASPTFTLQGANVSGDYVVTADPSNPPVMPVAGATATLVFWVDILPSATVSPIIAQNPPSLEPVIIDGLICVGLDPDVDCPNWDPDKDADCSYSAALGDAWNVMTAIKDSSAVHFPPDLTGMGIVPERFGSAVAVGEVNGLAGGDILVGDPGADVASLPDAGAGYLFGGIPLNPSCPIVTYDSSLAIGFTDYPQWGEYFGSDVAIGHVIQPMGLGPDDMIIAAPYYDAPGAAGAGKVSVFNGNVALWKELLEDPPEAGAHFGTSVAIGNFDGLNSEDVAVGVQNLLTSPSQVGEVYLFLSDGTGDFTSFNIPDPRAIPLGFNSFGFAVAAGSIGGDPSQDDLIVGAPTEAPFDQGVVYVYVDPVAGSAPIRIPRPVMDGFGNFGVSVAAGDIDGTGGPDEIVVGDSYALVSGPAAPFGWEVSLFRGTNHVATLRDPVPDGSMVWARVDVEMGDIDGDGRDDLLVGAGLATACGMPSSGEVYGFHFDTQDPPNLTGVRYGYHHVPTMLPQPHAQFGWSIAIGELDTGCTAREVVVGMNRADDVFGVRTGAFVVFQ